MKSVYIVKKGANNSFTIFEWGFFSFEEAEKFRDILDKNNNATSPASTISEKIIFESINEIIDEAQR